MTLELKERHGVPVAEVGGSLDVTNAQRLTDGLRDAVPNAALGLVMDLRNLTHLDSAGLHVIFDTVRRLARRQQRLLVIVDEQSLVADIAAATDLGSYATVGPDFDAAVERLRN